MGGPRRRSRKPSPSLDFLPHFERAELRPRQLCPELCPIVCAQDEERTDKTNRSPRSTGQFQGRPRGRAHARLCQILTISVMTSNLRHEGLFA